MLRFYTDPDALYVLYRKLYSIRNVASSAGLERISKRLIDSLKRTTKQAFEMKADPVTGAEWAPLAFKFKGSYQSTLHRSGHMKRSLRYKVTATDGSVQVRLISSVVYAPVHMYGSVKNNTPARPYSGFAPTTADDVRDEIRSMTRG